MNVEETIRAAIVLHRRLSFTYRGRPRIVNPERLGRTAKGTQQMRAVQVGGDSASGRYGGSAPKLFEVDQMVNATVLDAEFRVPRQYRRGDDAFVRIDAELLDDTVDR
jgi:hypothetical protein